MATKLISQCTHPRLFKLDIRRMKCASCGVEMLDSPVNRARYGRPRKRA